MAIEATVGLNLNTRTMSLARQTWNKLTPTRGAGTVSVQIADLATRGSVLLTILQDRIIARVGGEAVSIDRSRRFAAALSRAGVTECEVGAQTGFKDVKNTLNLLIDNGLLLTNTLLSAQGIVIHNHTPVLEGFPENLGDTYNQFVPSARNMWVHSALYGGAVGAPSALVLGALFQTANPHEENMFMFGVAAGIGLGLLTCAFTFLRISVSHLYYNLRFDQDYLSVLQVARNQESHSQLVRLLSVVKRTKNMSLLKPLLNKKGISPEAVDLLTDFLLSMKRSDSLTKLLRELGMNPDINPRALAKILISETTIPSFTSTIIDREAEGYEDQGFVSYDKYGNDFSTSAGWVETRPEESHLGVNQQAFTLVRNLMDNRSESFVEEVMRALVTHRADLSDMPEKIMIVLDLLAQKCPRYAEEYVRSFVGGEILLDLANNPELCPRTVALILSQIKEQSVPTGEYTFVDSGNIIGYEDNYDGTMTQWGGRGPCPLPPIYEHSERVDVMKMEFNENTLRSARKVLDAHAENRSGILTLLQGLNPELAQKLI